MAEPSGEGLLVEGLSHSYGRRRVLDGVSLAVPPGEVHCLLGASGSGKSTTLRLIAGLERLQAGRVALGGQLLADAATSLPPERRRVGLMFQDFALFPHLPVEENVAFGLAGGERRARTAELLARVNMTQHARSYPHALSGGEQQRVALARALAAAPRLLLLDEAFSALDAGMRAAIRTETLALLKEAGTPALLVTHDGAEAVRCGDRIHVLERGRIVQAGSPADLYANPVSAFVATLFGPVSRVAGRVRGEVAETPLGRVAAPGMAENCRVELVARPRALRVAAAEAGSASARLLERRDLGPAWLLSVGLADGSRIEVEQAEPPAAEPGEPVEIRLDPRHLFVYPAAG